MLPLTSSVSVCSFLFFFVRVGVGCGCCSWGAGGAADPGRVGPRRVATAAALRPRQRGVGRGRTAGAAMAGAGLREAAPGGCLEAHVWPPPGAAQQAASACWGEPPLVTRRGIHGHLPCHSPPACVGSRSRWHVAGGAGVGGRCGCVPPSGGGAQGNVTYRLPLGRLFWGAFERSPSGGSPTAGGGRRSVPDNVEQSSDKRVLFRLPVTCCTEDVAARGLGAASLPTERR